MMNGLTHPEMLIQVFQAKAKGNLLSTMYLHSSDF